MTHDARERAAEEALRELRREGLSRDALGDELVLRGYTRFEANCLLDGYGLPERDAQGAPDSRARAGAGERREDFDEADLPPPSGIGGWLLLPAIGLVLGPVQLGRSLWEGAGLLHDARVRGLEERWPGFARALLLEVLTNACLLVLLLGAALLFYARKRAAPRLMIVYLLVQALLVVATHAYAASVIPEPLEPYEAFGAVLAACIWVPYFAASVRVRNTFVR